MISKVKKLKGVPMEKIKCRNYWNDRNLELGLSHDKKMVAIGEQIDTNTVKFIHIKIKDFLDFAEKVTNEL